MKLTDMIISGLIKKGVLWEARNIKAKTEIPDTKMTVEITIEHMSIKFDKSEKGDFVDE